MKSDLNFCLELAKDDSLTESDVFIRAVWYLGSDKTRTTITFNSVCDFVEANSVRTNLNRSRLRTRLSGRKDVTVANVSKVVIPLKQRDKLDQLYAHHLNREPEVIHDTILELGDFQSARGYVSGIARQVNSCRQYEQFDACAVMMRRLMEVLIIDAFERKELRDKILHTSEYMQLSGLIGVIQSGKDFKLSRDAPASMETCKKLGDTAAHSKTYLTKRLDIDSFQSSFRKLISELLEIQT